jgi:hypothetical protein
MGLPSESLHSKIKGLEQEWMVLKDQYSDLARLIMNDPGDSWFGDVHVDHSKVLERLKEWVLQRTK